MIFARFELILIFVVLFVGLVFLSFTIKADELSDNLDNIEGDYPPLNNARELAHKLKIIFPAFIGVFILIALLFYIWQKR